MCIRDRNVQRENLSYIEAAQAYKRLITEHGLTQTEIARKVWKRQSTISNKLRLLALPEDIQRILAENRLSERHARALLRIEDDALRMQILEKIVKYNLNVTQSEKLISDILSKEEKKQMNGERVKFINYKLYINTIKKAFMTIQDAEKNAQYHQAVSYTHLYQCGKIQRKERKNSSDAGEKTGRQMY